MFALLSNIQENNTDVGHACHTLAGFKPCFVIRGEGINCLTTRRTFSQGELKFEILITFIHFAYLLSSNTTVFQFLAELCQSSGLAQLPIHSE